MKSLFGMMVLLLVWTSNAQSEVLTQSSTLLGKKLTVTQTSDATSDQRGVTTQTQIQFLGKARSLMEASVEAIPPAQEGEAIPPATDTTSTTDGAATDGATPGIPLAQTDLYIGGVRVWNGTLSFQKGGLVYSGGVPFTQVPFPIFAYPLGPLVLQVDAGIEFEGMAQASLLPGISIPIQDMTIDASLQADLTAAGYVEGYAKLLFVRAGVGGRVNFIDGETGLSAHVYFTGAAPQLAGFGKVVLLSGDVYGFVDSYGLFGGWKRWLSKDFFNWPGKCFALGEETCGTQSGQ